MADSVSALSDTHLTQSAFNTFCNDLEIAALRIHYCVDLAKPEIRFDLYLQGTRIGGGTLDPSNPNVTIEGSVLGVKARVTLRADFAQKQVTYEIELCVPIVGCASYSGVLFSWAVSDFSRMKFSK